MGQHCIICNFPCDDEVLFCPECVDADKSNERKIVNDECVDADKFNERKTVNDEVRELHRLWGQDCERMNKEIDRLNNELEEKKRNETESEKEET